ncbi:MAG: acyl-CoA dehydrogenase [Acidobacteria bacterium]|nr:acyl-CoA dehydrogenase [Acidobacteriota bacterium]
MNFSWTDHETGVRERIAAVVKPLSDELIRTFEQMPLPDLKRTVASIQESLAEAGGFVVGSDPESATQGIAESIHLGVLARASVSLFLTVRATAEFAGLVACFGDASMRAKILDPLAKGRTIGAVGLSELGEEAEIGPAHVTREGDSYRLTGRKCFVTNGPIADWVAVFAHLEGHDAICLVGPDQQGVSSSARSELMGLNGIAISDLAFDEVLVPRDHLLGPFDSTAARSWYQLSADLSIAVAACGLMERTVHAASEHARHHRRGGKEIFARQEVRFKLAEMLTLSQTADLLTSRAAWARAAQSPDARALIRCAKVFAVENAEKVAGMALQITAGAGYRKGSFCERAYRDAKGLALAGTAVEVSRMAIADEILERY